MTSKLQIPADFDDASPQERIEFVQRLWDEIASNSTAVPVPEHHKPILDERLSRHAATNGSDARDWNEVRDEVRAGLKGS